MGRRRTPTAKERWGPLVIVLCNGSGDVVRKSRAHNLNVMHFDLSQGLGGDYTPKQVHPAYSGSFEWVLFYPSLLLLPD